MNDELLRRIVQLERQLERMGRWESPGGAKIIKDRIEINEELMIQTDWQMTVDGPYTIDGALTLDGKLVIN